MAAIANWDLKFKILNFIYIGTVIGRSINDNQRKFQMNQRPKKLRTFQSNAVNIVVSEKASKCSFC